MRHPSLPLLALLLWPLPLLPAHAQSGDGAGMGLALGIRPVNAVIELFTSQGCSSCPPADALLKSYADRRDVMALSLPVDYWDYIGWKDTFAQPKNSERQRAYAKAFGTGPVYTPQAVINGTTQALGSSEREIDRAIEQAAAILAEKHPPVTFTMQENAIIIEPGPPAGTAKAEVKESTIWLAIVQKSGDVAIKRGENDGKTITYTNIVKAMTPIGVWNGKPSIVRLAPALMIRPDTETVAIIVQEGVTGTIVGAAWLQH